MVRENEIRTAEIAVDSPAPKDAGLLFIGRISTPWTSRLECPRQGRLDGPTCRIEVFDPWVQALDGIERYDQLEVLYWLHLSRRDLVRQSPANDGTTRGTFALRTPVRPIRSAPPSPGWSALRDLSFWCVGWIVSTERRCSILSPTGHCSHRLRRHRKAISRSAIPELHGATSCSTRNSAAPGCASRVSASAP